MKDVSHQNHGYKRTLGFIFFVVMFCVALFLQFGCTTVQAIERCNHLDDDAQWMNCVTHETRKKS